MITHEEWLKERKKGCGGSDIGSLWNLDFGCARKLGYDKTSRTPDFPQIEQPAEFERGTIMEPAIRTLYAKRSNRPTMPPTEQITWHLTEPRMFVSMDAVTRRGPGDNGYAEFKCVNRFVMRQFKTEGVRRSYILQMQAGLACSGYGFGSFGILCLDPWEFHWFDVEEDKDLQHMIAIEVQTFWHALDAGLLPNPLENDHDQRCFKCSYRVTCRGSEFSSAPAVEDGRGLIVSSPELLPIVSEWVELDQLKKAAEEAIEPIKEEIEKAIGTNYGISVPGCRVLRPTWPESRWDSKQLTQLLPRIQRAAVKDIWEFIDTVDIDAFPEVQEYVLLLSLIAKCKKPAQDKSSMRYYPGNDR